jgi:hypothetical protein
MTVGELIKELETLPQDLQVMAAGECAEKVIVEECDGHKYVRIFEPWDAEFVGRFEPQAEGSAE